MSLNVNKNLITFRRMFISVIALVMSMGFISALQASVALQDLEFTGTAGSSPVAAGSYGSRWERWYETGLGASGANDLVVDDSGNVYTVGYADFGIGYQAGNDILISKHSEVGTLLWEQHFTFDRHDIAVSVVLDVSGSYLYAVANTGSSDNKDIVVLKLNALDGSSPVGESWPVFFDGSAALEDEALVLALDNASNVYVLGQSDNGTDNDIVLLKYDSTGSLIDSFIYDGGVDEEAVALVLDLTGNVFVAGKTVDDYLIFKMGPVTLGSGGWGPFARADYGDQSNNVSISDMVVDSSGDVFFLATSKAGGADQILVTKISGGDGSQILDRFVGVSSTNIVSIAITLDAADDVYVGGRIFNGSTFKQDLLVAKIDGGSGSLSWPGGYFVYPASTTNDDKVVALRADADEVFVVADSGSDHLTLILNSSSGVLQQSTLVNTGGDDDIMALEIYQDARGDANLYLAAGSNVGPIFDEDFTVFKLGVMRPDLIVTSAIAPSLAVSGGSLVFDYQLNNDLDASRGINADSGDFSVSFYIDTIGDPVVRTELDTSPVSVSSLGAGLSSAVLQSTFSVPLVGDLPEGNYNLVVAVDGVALVDEADESNNEFAVGVVQVIDPPDLVPVAVTAQSLTVPAAGSVIVDFEVQNLRVPAAGVNFDVSFFLSDDDVVGNDISLLGSAIVNGLGNLASYNGSVLVTLPNTVLPGSYRLGVIVDSGAAILEANENNNSLINTNSSEYVNASSIVDLTVDTITSPLGGEAGGNVSLFSSIQADAGGAAGTFDVGFYLSSDSALSGDDVRLGSRIVSGLSSGAVESPAIESIVTIPLATLAGEYYILAYADDTDVYAADPAAGLMSVSESNENNNVKASSRTIVVGLTGALPDLLVSSVTAAPIGGPAIPGGQLSITSTVENVLSTPVNTAFRVGLYISSDATITTNDVWLGEYDLPSLAGDDFDVTTTTVTIPTSELEDIVWTGLVDVSVSGTVLSTNLTRRPTSAYSSQTMDEDGVAEFVVREVDSVYSFGLDPNSIGINLNNLDHALTMRLGFIRIVENGNIVAYQGGYTTGDVMGIERVGTTVRYLRNGTPIYTSSKPASSAPLRVNVVFSSGASSIEDATVNNVRVKSGSSYYIGAIVDTLDAVAEVSETNNAWVATASNDQPESILMSVVNAQLESSSGSGGGNLGVITLLLLMFSGLIRIKVKSLAFNF